MRSSSQLFAWLCLSYFALSNAKAEPSTLLEGVNDKKRVKVKIAFGSCVCKNFEIQKLKNQNATIFEQIAYENASLFIWMGDSAYVENRLSLIPFFYSRFTLPDSDAEIIHRFETTKQDPSYQQLVQTGLKIIGTWDDHDYGQNDGDKYFQDKEKFRQFFLDFLDENKNSDRRSRKGGIYQSYYLDSSQLVKIILLDCRWNRDTIQQGKDTLGEEQWLWLAQEFQDDNPQLIILGSSIQLIPDDRMFREKWFAQSRARLYKLMKKNDLQRYLIISGDVHHGEIFQDHLGLRSGPLVEVTSSGMFRTALLTDDLEKDGFTKEFQFEVFEMLQPDSYSKKGGRFYQNNYAVLELSKIINKNDTVSLQSLTISIKNIDGKSVLTKKIRLNNKFKAQPLLLYKYIRDIRKSSVFRRQLNTIINRFIYDSTQAKLIAFIGLVVGIFVLRNVLRSIQVTPQYKWGK